MNTTIFRLSLIILISISLIFPVSSYADWNSIGNSTIAWGDDRVLDVYNLYFGRELKRLDPLLTSEFKHVNASTLDYDSTYDHVSAIDIAELESVLMKEGFSIKRIGEILKEYNVIRLRLAPYQEGISYYGYCNWNYTGGTLEEYWRERGREIRQDMKIKNDLDSLVVPDGLPAQFDLYIRGAIAYHNGEWDIAEKHWNELLQLPVGERRLRTTWATFMLGRIHIVRDPAKASEYFSSVRDLARKGFPDPIGLASSTYLWQGRAEYRQENFRVAIKYFLTSHAAGDINLAVALSIATHDWYHSVDGEYDELLADPVLRKLLTIMACTRTSVYNAVLTDEQTVEWIDTIDEYWEEDIDIAEVVVWEAYRQGNFELAQRWLDRCPDDAPLAPWLEAMLLMREQNFRDAEDILERIRDVIPEQDTIYYNWLTYEDIPGIGDAKVIPDDLASQLAVTYLQRMRFEDALFLFMQTDYWRDAAYIAERVLSIEELIEFVDGMREYIDEIGPTLDDSYTTERYIRGLEYDLSGIRYILGRRLCRLDRWDEGINYLPEEMLVWARDYIFFLDVANNDLFSDEDRARGFWNAAEILKLYGMELIGTQLAPDWTGRNGRYNPPSRILDARSEYDETSLYPSTAYERLRLYRTSEETLPYKRFHYRYKALDLYWEAIELMPDNTNETANKIWEAGNWMKYFDPQAVDRFYKALVIRCPDTALGWEADALRWFPKYPEWGC